MGRWQVGRGAVGGVGGDEGDGEGVGAALPVHHWGVVWWGCDPHTISHIDGDGGCSIGRVDGGGGG